ncbi:hypothetical protein DSM112329_01889 [Paraconexibacter sp. AEG42_29]|uniref:Uncharacterized protein n=1 Tax=Paraconexibacter sp. AEG42_29 TaxID=2997339 RepID=A0AAU7ATQ7_9ACTN
MSPPGADDDRTLDARHARPEGTGDKAVEAAGKLTEALETLGRARGHLLSFHQLVGATDLALDDAVDLLREAGRDDLADAVATDLVGRNVIAGRWTFQLVEEFDDGYHARFAEHERAVRDALTGGRRHVFEAEMKERRRTHGRRGHEATPGDV